MTQHSGLSAERWRSFPPEQRLLMIANEMHRIRSSFGSEHERSRRLGYERVLALTDLTIEVTGRRGLRAELLRWRDLPASLLAGKADQEAHAAALRALLSLSPAGWRQLRALARRATPEAPSSATPR